MALSALFLIFSSRFRVSNAPFPTKLAQNISTSREDKTRSLTTRADYSHSCSEITVNLAIAKGAKVCDDVVCLFFCLFSTIDWKCDTLLSLNGATLLKFCTIE